jgi:hypothetical protein
VIASTTFVVSRAERPRTGRRYPGEQLRKLGISDFYLQLARVSRVDAAIDIDGCCPSDWAWDIPQRKKRKIFANDGRIETIYLGGKTGSPLVVYDKARQLKLPKHIQRTRIEFRSRFHGFVNQLPEMACPFGTLLVFNAELKGKCAPLPALSRDMAKVFGRRVLLSHFPESTRKALIAELATTTPNWWQPAEIWQGWGEALESQLPGLFISEAEIAALKNWVQWGFEGLPKKASGAPPSPHATGSSMSAPPAG